MKNKKYWFGLALMGWASHAFAQNEVDALRYSRLQFGGTARTQAIGGANVAVGADLGSLVSNPAGLGLYQKSEISFSPGYSISNTSSSGIGTTATDSRSNLNLASFGVAFTNRRPDNDNDNWRGGTFAFGLNRINDFNNRFNYSGTVNNNRSLFEYLRQAPRSSYNSVLDQYDADQYTNLDGLAYATSLSNIEPAYRNGPDTVVTTLQSGAVAQNEYVLTKGSQTQFDFGYGASYRDKLYVGGALGIVSTRYDETRVQNGAGTEPGSGTIPTRETTYSLRDDLTTRGSGFNLRIGAIYRITDMVRVGASVQTPTFMRLRDNYSTSLSTTFSPALVYYNNNNTVSSTVASASASAQPSDYTYNLTTPFRASGGVAVTIGKYGFLSGDVEYLNYGQAKLNDDNTNGSSSGGNSFDSNNQVISSLYRSTVNIRVGGEARYDIFRFRLGYARYGDPYNASDFDRTQNYFTGGLGLRQNNFFLDLAGVYSTNDRYYNPYTLNGGTEPVIAVNSNRFTTTATVGFTF